MGIKYQIALMGKSALTCCQQQPQPIRQSRISKIPNEHMSSTGIFCHRNFSLNLFFGSKYLGKGVYGSTILVFSKDNKSERYAQKIVDINRLQEDYAFMHPDIIKNLRPPKFIDVKVWTVQNQKLYVVMENMDIGNLYYHLKKNQKALDYRTIRQICQFCIHLLDQIHSMGMICRNLRPENILIANKDGCLTFSEPLFSVIGPKLYSYLGCANYSPPEVYLYLHSEGYDKSLDIWMLGVMLYEMIFGVTPFEGHNIDEIKQKVINFSPQKLNFRGKDVPEELRDLIEIMLIPDPKKRITLEQIKEHCFVNQQKQMQKKVQVSLITLQYKLVQKQQIQPPSRIPYCDFAKTQPVTRDISHFFNEDII